MNLSSPILRNRKKSVDSQEESTIIVSMNASKKKRIVIGLTGNIATGKSVVRLMLEHLGAYSIDADKLAHKLYSKKAPAFKPIVDYFGKWIINDSGEIDRKKLGQIVFNNPEDLLKLEEFVHPYVLEAIQYLIEKSNKKLIVIEAVKIFDSPLKNYCDKVWVTTTSRENQFSRLIKNRHMTAVDAQTRIDMQGSPQENIKKADFVINTNGTIEKTWKQVQTGWDELVGDEDLTLEEIITFTPETKDKKQHSISLLRAKPSHAQEIANFINKHKKDDILSATDIMISFGEKAYFIMKDEDNIVGIAGWQIENLVVKVDNVIFAEGYALEESLRKMFNKIERSAEELNAEVAIVLIPKTLSNYNTMLTALSYEETTLKNIRVKAWKDIISTTETTGQILWVKALRRERILRPF